MECGVWRIKDEAICLGFIYVAKLYNTSVLAGNTSVLAGNTSVYTLFKVMAMRRGAFLLLEGIDRAGKTTQAKVSYQHPQAVYLMTDTCIFPEFGAEAERKWAHGSVLCFPW